MEILISSSKESYKKIWYTHTIFKLQNLEQNYTYVTLPNFLGTMTFLK